MRGAGIRTGITRNSPDSSLIDAYKLRWKRRRLLWRAFAKRRELQSVTDRTASIRPGDILCFATARNEANRIPYYLRHYRDLGVAHFLIVDNASTDDTPALLADQPDVSVWTTDASYRASRFGVDWLTWLQLRHGHGHWCLTADADELLLIPHHGSRDLHDLTGWLEGRGAETFAATMLDLYPEGRLSDATCPPDVPPQTVLTGFDAQGYTWEYQPKYRNISVRGGVRKRLYFSEKPDHAPHLHKTPLIRWNRRYAYVSSTHIALPRRLNAGLDARLNLPTGVLLHSKFLAQVVPKSAEEKRRGEHFTHKGRYDAYYDQLAGDPVLWSPDAARFRDWQQLEALGLMTRGCWTGGGDR